MRKDKNGKIECDCEKRTLPKPFVAKEWEDEYDIIVDKYGEDSEILEEFLRQKFATSAMNVCKTQPLDKMNVSPMSVELKNARANRHPLKTTRIIPTPLALQEEAYKQIENDVNMGILENVTNGANLISPPCVV